jgi:hypothetical protein
MTMVNLNLFLSNSLQMAPINCFVKDNFESTTKNQFCCGNLAYPHITADLMVFWCSHNGKTMTLGNQLGIDLSQKQ